MIEVKIPKEISEYKVKIISGFDVRQSLSIVMACSLAFGVYKIYGDTLSIDTISNIIIPFVIPIFLLGFLKYENLSVDEYIILFIRFLFYNPKNRVFQEIDINTQIAYETLEHSNKEIQEIYLSVSQSVSKPTTKVGGL